MDGDMVASLEAVGRGEALPAILGHPFLKGLADGTLPEAKFRHYVGQDALYLRDFGRGLALLAAKGDGPEALQMFCRHAQTTVLVEQALHAGFLSELGAIAGARPGPTTAAYVNFLLRTVYDRPWHEALGAFLPCYWVYARVGAALLPGGSPHPLYQRWIGTYGGEAFAADVRDMLATVGRAAADLTAAQQERMRQAFRQGCVHEYLFWDAAYREEAWPAFAG